VRGMEEEVFSKQSQLIRQGVIMLENRIKRLQPKEEEKDKISFTDSVIQIFEIRSISFYKDTLNFLATEVIDSDPKRAIFLLPNIRTLLDIYARFLHLQINCSDDDKRAMTCISYQLMASTNPIYERTFDNLITYYKDYLDQVRADYPRDLNTFKYGWLVKNGYIFEKRESLLTPDNTKRYSTLTIQVFGAENSYEIYSHISELLHGNPYLYDEENTHNERFWVVSMAIVVTAFIVELIDRYILDRGEPRDFREWLASVKSSRDEFASVWKTKQPAQNKKPN